MDVHEPYIPERKFIDMVDPSINLTRDEMFNLFKNVVLKRDMPNERTLELLKKLYHAHVREVDGYIKDFFDLLGELDLLRDSVVVITSDHGDEFGEHGGLSHDGKMYSELIDAPLLVYDYDRARGEVHNTLLSTVDIPPTIVHLFGLEPVRDFEGHSLLPPGDYPEKGCFGEAIGKIGHKEKDTDKPVYFYRVDDLKIIYRESGSIWEMYNLKEDPKEVNNIIDTSSEARDMKEKLRSRAERRARE